MKPFTIYQLCRGSFISLQQLLVDIIVKSAKPEVIFLLGASLYRRRSESIFLKSAPTCHHISDCFLLILMQDLANQKLHEWQDKIENDCKALMPVTTIVLKKTTFEEWLKDGHQCATTIPQSAIVIYNRRNFDLSSSPTITNDVTVKPLE